MAFTIGLQIGPYRILEQLGQGGMATVYKGYHAALDRYVAIKVLHQAFLEDPNFHARFQREARLVAKLEHPNIVPIYDYAEHEGQPYLVMKYIEGETLKARLQRGMLNASEVLTIIETVGAGLAYAHKQGILHRDIKPSNVILATDGGIYLADFGLARIAQSGESTLTSDMVLGTPQYISPEQAMARKDLDAGTDIYSFGVMLYEMTVGRVPFSADTPFSVIHDHIYTPLPLPTTVNPKISAELERVLLKALAKERADRYNDVPAFIEAFKAAWSNSAPTVSVTPAPGGPNAATVPPSISAPLTMPVAVSAEAPAAPPTANGKKKSRKRWWWVAGVIGLCLCSVIFLAIGASNAKKQQAEATQQAAEAASVVPPADATKIASPPPPEQPDGENIPSVEIPAIELEAAHERVKANPDDPLAHIQLGVALVKNGQPHQGYDQIRQAAEMAADNRPWLLGTGLTLEKIELPLGAAMLYVRAADNFRPQMPGAEARLENLRRVIYYSFSDPLAPEFINFETLGKIDHSLVMIAEVRHAIFKHPEDINPTQEVINQWRKEQPDLPEIELLQGELLMAYGKPEEARKVLKGLSQRPKLPPWIEHQTQEFLAKLP